MPKRRCVDRPIEVRSWPTSFQVVLAIALAARAALLVRQALGRFALARRVGDTPLAKIGALRDGVASVRARVADDARRLESPLTRRPCVYYRLPLREKQVRLVRREGGVPRLQS